MSGFHSRFVQSFVNLVVAVQSCLPVGCSFALPAAAAALPVARLGNFVQTGLLAASAAAPSVGSVQSPADLLKFESFRDHVAYYFDQIMPQFSAPIEHVKPWAAEAAVASLALLMTSRGKLGNFPRSNRSGMWCWGSPACLCVIPDITGPRNTISCANQYLEIHNLFLR